MYRHSVLRTWISIKWKFKPKVQRITWNKFWRTWRTPFWWTTIRPKEAIYWSQFPSTLWRKLASSQATSGRILWKFGARKPLNIHLMRVNNYTFIWLWNTANAIEWLIFWSYFWLLEYIIGKYKIIGVLLVIPNLKKVSMVVEGKKVI